MLTRSVRQQQVVKIYRNQVAGNHYFPPDSVNMEFFEGSDLHGLPVFRVDHDAPAQTVR
jgi:uncharacterized protein (DUF427 family)